MPKAATGAKAAGPSSDVDERLVAILIDFFRDVGADRAARASGVASRMIACLDGEQDQETLLDTLELVRRYFEAIAEIAGGKR